MSFFVLNLSIATKYSHTWDKFKQHFKRCISANFFSGKNTMLVQESCLYNFSAKKLRLNCWWNWHRGKIWQTISFVFECLAKDTKALWTESNFEQSLVCVTKANVGETVSKTFLRLVKSKFCFHGEINQWCQFYQHFGSENRAFGQKIWLCDLVVV